jgi:hypothetical protein
VGVKWAEGKACYTGFRIHMRVLCVRSVTGVTQTSQEKSSASRGKGVVSDSVTVVTGVSVYI